MQRNQTPPVARKKLQLVVEPTPRCRKLLLFIKEHIPDIKALNIIVYVTKAPTDPQKIKALAGRGISSTPAMIGTEGSIYIGERKIYAILQANFKSVETARAASQRMVGPAMPGYDPTDVHSYLMSGMYGGIDRSGRMMPREDDEETNDLASQLADRTRSFEERRRSRAPREADRGPGRRPPKSRRGRGADDPEIEEGDNVGAMGGDDDEDGEWGAPAPRRGGGAPAPKLPPRQKRPPSGNPADMDALMMDAWMDNNVASD